MFNKNFYPTPKEVIYQMIGNLDFQGKVVLEPSAGKGDIVEVLKELGAEVLVCENNTDLAKICSAKADKFLWDDFLQLQPHSISHIDYIVMNPPFDKADEHILHAWEIAPDGCEIIALCNWETIDNRYTFKRRGLNAIINDFGNSENLGDCFSDSERKTGVEVGLVRLFKPKKGENEFNGYFSMEEEHEQGEVGIMPHNEIREIVNRYVGAVKMFDDVIAQSNKVNDLCSVFGRYNLIKFGAYKRNENNYNDISRDEFKKELQKSAWEYVFGKLNMEKYLTSSLKSELNNFVEKQTKIPFTMTNIYKMVEMVVKTNGQRMDRVLLEVFDKITMHYHENRYEVEGWKTNSHYIINKKIIFPYLIESSFRGNMSSSYRGDTTLSDLNKALCYMTGVNHDTIPRVSEAIEKENAEFGQWFNFGFFEAKGYKKGTLHLKFKDLKVWEKLNRRIGELRGFPLPEKI